MTQYSGIFFGQKYRNQKTQEDKTRWIKVGEVYENQKGLSLNLYDFIDLSKMASEGDGIVRLMAFQKDSSNASAQYGSSVSDEIPF